MGGRRLLVLNERDLLHPQAGGAEVHCFEVFRRLAARGDAVTLVSCGFPGAAPSERVQGIEVVRVGERVSYYPGALRTYRRLRAVAPFDAVVEDLNKFPFFSRFWVREPIVVLVHHFFGRTAFQQVAWPLAAATFAAEKLVPRLYRGLPVVAVSPSTRDELVAGGMRAGDVHVIPNGLDHTLYRPGAGTRAAVPMVLALGRIEPYKRTELLVDAVARIPGARLVVAGSGTAMEALRAHVERSGCGERVELLGFVDEAEKVRLLQEAHVVATASRKEGWGLTVVEAAACGTPSVAFDVPGLRDAIRNGETGLLVPADDADAFAAALRRVLEDAALRERLAAGAIAWARRFTWDNAAEAIGRLIDEAIAARQGRERRLASG
ncbi:MAG TPA: glycosyltransferase family 4 protein [Candidatus Limnocylindria bacterium]|nr:glycosyltransferase family 4 protein [Candidatus Limnocylindria bacterium]